MIEKERTISKHVEENVVFCSRYGILHDLTEERVRREWGGLLQEMNCTPFGSYYFARLGGGWADSGKALQIMVEEAIQMGIKYETGQVSRILVGEKGGVQGVQMDDGSILRANKVLLATGAWTNQLMSPLEDDLGLPDRDRVESQVTAAGVCVAHFQLSDEERDLYSRLPVVIYGEQGEVIPPTSTGILT